MLLSSWISYIRMPSVEQEGFSRSHTYFVQKLGQLSSSTILSSIKQYNHCRRVERRGVYLPICGNTNYQLPARYAAVQVMQQDAQISIQSCR